MNSDNESRQEGGLPQPQQEHEERRNGHSGEGAASALAQLKTQTKQHRRQAGDNDEVSGGASQ